MSLHWQHGIILLTKRAQSKLPISFDLKLLSSIQWLQNFQTSIVTENVLILWEIEKEKKNMLFSDSPATGKSLIYIWANLPHKVLEEVMMSWNADTFLWL